MGSFIVLTLLHVRSDKDHRSTSYEKLKEIPLSKYLEITFTSSQLGLAGFLGTITIKTLILVVSKEYLYKAAQVRRIEDEKIFRIMKIAKTKKLDKSITIITNNGLDILNDMADYKYNKLFDAYARHPKIMKPGPGKSCTNLLQRECDRRIQSFVRYDNLLQLINVDTENVLKVSEEAREYFVACVAYYAFQLTKCYKLLP